MINDIQILAAKYIIPEFSKSISQSTTLTDKAIAIASGKVLAIGELENLTEVYPHAKVKILGDALIMPGLINSHAHMPMSILRGFADDLSLMDWLQNYIWAVEGHLTEEWLEIGTLLSCAEMMMTGTTTFMDMYFREDIICRTAEGTGMRGVYGEGITIFPTLGCKDPALAFDRVRELYHNHKHCSRSTWCVSPHSVYTTNPKCLEGCVALAEELDLPIHIHLAETTTETGDSIKLFGMRPVELCHKVGILGPKTTIAHGVDLNDDELSLLFKSKTKVAHNPKSNLKLASGVARVADMLEMGIEVGIGTDGAASNNSLNMFQELNYAALLQKGIKLNARLVPASTSLYMATKGSAYAVHQPELGSLKEGSPADLIALDLNYPNLTPMHDPVSCLAYSTNGYEVCLNMIDGEILYENGKFTRFDFADVKREADQVINWIKNLK